jgi:hypothetical protein
MRVLQTIYTSCIKGQSGASGFQFYSHSEGLTSEELLELEKLGNYIAPIGAQSSPVVFSYFHLKSGKRGVLQSLALEKDYSGRPGNFFAHAFILESGEFPFLPIYLYQSKSFRTELTDAELNVSAAPAKLPALEVDSLLKNSEISLNSASNFLKEKDAEGNFKKLVNAVIENSETKRNIILSAKSEDAIQWIAALWFAFPARFLQNFTFSTYSVDPGRGNVLVGATVSEGSRFDFNSQMAFNHQFYVFDFEAERISPMEHESIYADIANTAITYARNNKIEEFGEFLGKYNYPCINRDIGDAWSIFAEQEANLSFMFKYAKPETITSFWANPDNLSCDVCKYALEHNIKSITELRDMVIKNNNFNQLADLMPLFLEKLDEHGKEEYFWKSVTPFTSPQHKECGKQMLKHYIKVASKKEELMKLIFFADSNGYSECEPELLRLFEDGLKSYEEFAIDKLEKLQIIKEKNNLPIKGSKLNVFLITHKIRKASLEDYKQIFPVIMEVPQVANDPAIIYKIANFAISMRKAPDEYPNMEEWLAFAVDLLQKMRERDPKEFKAMDNFYSEKKFPGWNELKEIIIGKSAQSGGMFGGIFNIFKSKK